MATRQPPGSISISRYDAVPAAGELSPSGTLSPGGHGGDNARNYVDSPGSRNNETGYFGTVPLSPMSEDSTAQPPATHPSQYYRDAPRAPFARDTVISGVSGFSGVTDHSGRTVGSDPAAPMLPENLKSAFDDDVPEKPKQRVVLCGIKRSNFFILLVLVLFLIGVGVAVGVGVGLGMPKTDNSSPFSEQPEKTASSTDSSAVPTATTEAV
ncbi:hypothetical protein INS49_011505 [Diaporthe citri]|uniref:uncharacterized protein n=1 Tax=Diaporthe citri TaxID=83186 RepID=UPI001C815FC5|nr:uncharacterized protein INS49_011505 [Diaporthe citri]KAG6360443.1 hypothetical protein INS49_011505 [Diaporthe citri]